MATVELCGESFLPSEQQGCDPVVCPVLKRVRMDKSKLERGAKRSEVVYE